ncbi:MAG: hypothetical protein P8N76_20365 [Pirellulaceae bacterium]|nr:hypothetical protein [Pirellulaceae bacterium]
MKQSFVASIAIGLGMFVSFALLWGQTQKPQEPRARYPRFEQGAAGIFFDDAFAEGLLGSRPRRSTRAGATDGQTVKSPTGEANQVAGSFAWSAIVSPSTIEDEVKAIKLRLDQSLTSAGHFKGLGYRQARIDLTAAAMLFAIVDQYDGEVRWKKSARIARDRMAHTAKNAKIGTTGVYRETKQRQIDFQDLVGGSTLAADTDATDTDAGWSAICERAPLMMRIKQSQQDRLASWLASEQEFKKERERIVREGQLMASMAEVLTREGMVDADDDDYVAYCRQLKDAALEIVDAVKREDYGGARESAGKMQKSCSDCHELYRA